MKKILLIISSFLFLPSIKAMDNCFLDTICFTKDGNYYYSEDTSLTYKIEEDKKIFYENNKPYTGFKTYQNKKYYFLNGIYICYQENDTYYIGDTLYTGLLNDTLINNGLKENKDGIITTTNGIYYLKNNKVVKNTWYLNHYFDDTGKSLKGVNKIDNKYYLFDDEGLLYNPGWKNYHDEVYHVEKDKTLTVGLVTIDGDEYYFDKYGKLTDGLINYQEKYFYIDGFGKKDNGLVKNNKDYYFLKKGKLVKNSWMEEQGYKYYFGKDGKAYQGLKKINNNYYYFNMDATMQKGFIKINDKLYYFDKQGKMVLKNQKINNQNIKFSSQGYIINSWVNYKGYKYLTKKDGSLVTYWYNYKGKKYFFDGEGRLLSKNANMVVDVSKYQGNIDWNLVKINDNIDGVIVRLGYGTSYEDEECVMDSYFLANINALENLDIPYALYLYSYAIDTKSAKAEAQFVINTLHQYNIKNVTVYYDIESNRFTKFLDKNDYDNIITTFVTRVRASGYDSYVYTYTNLAKNKFSDKINNYVTWIAEYNKTLAYKGDEVKGWQYTSSGIEQGFDGRIDISVWNKFK